MKFKSSTFWLVGLYGLLIIIIAIYSYAFVDLNLTLSGNILYQAFQKPLTQLGYFNRATSALIFLLLLGAITFFYILFLRRVKEISQEGFMMLLLVLCILTFAYPAFSHDFFNYMFDSRIVTEYGLSPYFFRALDFPDDPWTRFMHWTHRYYPYGPAWLVLTLIPSWFGMSKFVFTLLLYKLFFLVAYLLNCLLIKKLADKSHASEREAVLFFALNPLVIVESLISPHNESIMLLFTLLALYLYNQNRVSSFISLLTSVGIKFVSIIFLPFYFLKSDILKKYSYLFGLWLVILLPVIAQREAYPWYFVPLVAFAALSQSHHLKQVAIAGSVGLLMRYVPTILSGSTSAHVANWMLAGFIIVFIALYLLPKKDFLPHN